MTGNWRPDHWGLTSRIVALSLVLFLLVQAAVFSVVQVGVEQNARSQVAQELQVGERIWRRLLDQNSQKLSLGANLLATDFGFRSAVSSGDIDTIRSALENNGARIGATVTALMATDMTLKTVGDGQDTSGLADALRQMVPALARDPQGSQIALVGKVPYQFVMVPMKAPQLVGWVLMGFPINQSLLDDMRAISDMQLVLVSQTAADAARVVATTLPAAVVKLLPLDPVELSEFPMDGDRLIIHKVKLNFNSPGSVQTLLLRSVNDVVTPFREAQNALALITAVGAVLFGIGSIFATRRVTTPLRDLVQATERLGLGLYDVAMEHTKRQDEIGGLAKAFDRMRVNIGSKQEEIRNLAFWDRLTGLPNREQFRSRVQDEIDLNSAEPAQDKGVDKASVSIVMLDIDRFKHVNDVLGYSVGDQLLIAVAKRLLEQDLREGDVLARLGGDEFAILLPSSSEAGALRVAHQITRSFEMPLQINEQTVDLNASIGIACFPGHAHDADTLMSRAEIAMYAAKSKTTVTQVYHTALDSSSSQSLSLLTELRHAVDHGELRLFLQPKISLNSAAVVAVEALVRWQHTQRGLLAPQYFIPFAEQTGFVRQLTLWVFEEAARSWHSLQLGHTPLQISINLSTRDLLDTDFPARLSAILTKHGVQAAGFCLEITESAIMDDPQRAQGTLNRLNDLGFKLSIDDFGTGYSSLAYLKRLPVSELKIDKSFVMNMERDEDDAKIVRSTIDLAHNLGLTVIAEGVENVNIWHKLKELSCDEAQGYFMGKPMPQPEFIAWRAHWIAP
jgi:diguanylate cyclase (GGDEF)-like protein